MTVYSIKDYQTYLGRQVLNVYWYEGAAGGVATDLGNAFLADVMPDILAIQHTGVNHERIVVEAFDSIVDFAEITVSAAGTGAGALSMAAFIAWGFRLERTTKLTRHGQKRIAGANENWVINEGIDPSVVALFDAAETALAQSVSLVGGDYVPVIMERQLNPITNQYELTGATNLVSSATFTGLTTQNSRKA